MEFSFSSIYDEFPLELVGIQNPFRWGLDVYETEKMLIERVDNVKMILMTLTNNSRAAQPVSMKNLREVK